jgi:hypothetical protein
MDIRSSMKRCEPGRELRRTTVAALVGVVVALGAAAPAPAATRCVASPDLVRWQPAPYPASRRVLQVGPQRAYPTLAAVAAAARDGDVIEIDAGEYNESVLFKADDLWLRGVGGRPHLKAPAKLFMDKAILVFRGANPTIENLEFSGARAKARNGAGIRHQQGNLTIRNSLFRDSDNGILTAHDPQGVVLVEFSEFARNGFGDGLSHNIYVGRARRFELRHSYSHGAKEGHLLKSRAAENLIEYNWLVDDSDGRTSYEIDITFPGETLIVGNVIAQAASSPNHSIVSYAAGKEKATPPTGRLTVAYNTIFNSRNNPVFVNNNSTGTALVVNNVFGGPRGREDLRGPIDASGNVALDAAAFVAAGKGDFRLATGAKAIDAAVPTTVRLPRYEPSPRLGSTLRLDDGRPDAGALEHCRDR